MQQYEKEINALKLKNKHLQNTLENFVGFQTRIRNLVLSIISGVVGLFLIVALNFLKLEIIQVLIIGAALGVLNFILKTFLEIILSRVNKTK